MQRSADKVRVNVQLIDTRTNAHLWASSYDRKLDDVFAVETEVANTIAQQLDAKLVQRISTKRPTANTAAYMLICAELVSSTVNPVALPFEMLPKLMRKPSGSIRILPLPGPD